MNAPLPWAAQLGRQYWDGLLRFFFGRALPLGVFGFIVAVQGQLAMEGAGKAVSGQLDAAGELHVLNRVLTLAFFTFLLGIYVIRGQAVAKDHNPVAVAAAMTGSFILFSLPLVPGRTLAASPAILAASNVLLTIGILIALYSLSYLRNHFSIVPEARGLITTGPYGIVRHPVYLGELVSGLGLILPTFPSLQVAVFLIFLAAQLMRIHYEERVLARTYPPYAAYARSTPRLVPFLY